MGMRPTELPEKVRGDAIDAVFYGARDHVELPPHQADAAYGDQLYEGHDNLPG